MPVDPESRLARQIRALALTQALAPEPEAAPAQERAPGPGRLVEVPVPEPAAPPVAAPPAKAPAQAVASASAPVAASPLVLLAALRLVTSIGVSWIWSVLKTTVTLQVW